jgi:thermitase
MLGGRRVRAGIGTNLSQARVLSVAVVVALVLVWISPDARGATVLKLEKGRHGSFYAAGELLVSYESGATRQHVGEVVERSRARVEDEIPVADAQLLSFPAIKHEQSGHVRKEKLRKAKQALEKRPGVEHVDYNYLRQPYYEPNDTRYQIGAQWDLDSINAPEAWNKSLGKGVRVAVVDSGIDADHPDLKSKIALQKDLLNNDDLANDDVGHGTHVAGTIGAATNNGRGVAAVCPACKLLAAKVGNSTGIFDADIAQGIYWSVNNRASAINISIGGRAYSLALKHAVDYAWEHDVVVVASAGNEDTDAPSYPAAFGHVISVSATDRQNGKAEFSNYGPTIDVAAPGVEILSTVPGGGYELKQGTSMASPHVAALAGLLATGDLSAQEIRRRIERTATDIGPEGKDRFYGSGLINANKAVRR